MRDKPAYGTPCNQCGRCCIATACPASIKLVGGRRGEPCPALQAADDHYVCGLVASPERYAPVRVALFGRECLSQAALLIIGDKVGCDSPTLREYRAPDYFAKRDAIDLEVSKNRLERLRAAKVWGLA